MEAVAFMPAAEAIALYLARVPPAQNDIDMELRHLRRSVAQAMPRPGFTRAAGRSYATILGSAIAAGRDSGVAVIADGLAKLPVPLPWHYHYATRPGQADLADSIGFAELIGPNAPLTAPTCRIGFTLMAASTFYPMHAHPAIELYLVIAGCAQWITPDSDRIVPPGDFVLHRANEPHAMRTFADPLLALYAWRGDIDAPAVYL